MSLTKADEASGIDRSTIQKFERGERFATAQHLIQLAGAYGVDRHLLLLHAGFVELRGFDALIDATEEEEALDQLFKQASQVERRELAKFLASLRMTSPMMEHLFAHRAS